MADVPLEVDVLSVKKMLDEKAPFTFVDCRKKDEHDTCRIDGASLLPMSELQQRVEELLGHEDDLVVVHCHHGGRSLRVARWLRQQGFPKAQSMAGGIDAWSLQIDPAVPRY
jgi:rhodanese-related sulfurtransferase